MSKFRKFTIWASGTVAFAGVTAAVKQSFFLHKINESNNSFENKEIEMMNCYLLVAIFYLF